MDINVFASVILPFILAIVMFISWAKNQFRHPGMAKLAITFFFIFIGIGVSLLAIWMLLK